MCVIYLQNNSFSMFEYLVESHAPFEGNTQWVVKSPNVYSIGDIINISPTLGTSIPGTVLRMNTEGPDSGGGGHTKEETPEEKERQRKKDSGEGWYWNK